MKCLLDTNIIVEHLRGKKPLPLSLIKKGCGISIITQAELFYGAYKSNEPAKNLKSIKDMLSDLGIEIVYLNNEIINTYGKIKAELEKIGEKLDEFDLLIGCSAKTRELQLVTHNKKHFERIKNLNLTDN